VLSIGMKGHVPWPRTGRDGSKRHRIGRYRVLSMIAPIWANTPATKITAISPMASRRARLQRVYRCETRFVRQQEAAVSEQETKLDGPDFAAPAERVTTLEVHVICYPP